MTTPDKPSVVVLGGGADQVPLVQALESRGYATVLVDYTPSPPAKAFCTIHVQESSLDPERVRAIAQNTHAVFITSIGNDRVLSVIAEVSSELGLPTPMGPVAAGISTNKERMREAFAAAGVRMPAALSLTEAKLDDLPYPLVVKPVRGTSSEGVQRIDEPSTLQSLLRESAASTSMVAQEFIAGGEISVDCFAVDGKAQVVLVSELHQVPGLGNGFSILQTQYPPAISVAATEQVGEQAQFIADAFELRNGPFFYQAKVKGDAVHVLEGSARIAGGLKHRTVETITGFDILAAQIDALEGRRVSPVPEPRCAAASQVFVLARKGRLAQVEIPQDKHLVHQHMFRSLGEELSGGTAAKDRVISLTVVAEPGEDIVHVRSEVMRRLVMEDGDGRDLVRRELYS